MSMCENIRERFLLRGVVMVRRRLVILMRGGAFVSGGGVEDGGCNGKCCVSG
jgi:hypothetical protein